jgi:outer membrane protein assembly factor BamB
MVSRSIALVGMSVWIGLAEFPSGLQAENWPRFRGPTGQGLSAEKGLPLRWTSTSNVVWKAAVPGEGWSSPVVWGDRVFVTTATDGGTVCRVLALDRSSGAVVWDRALFDQVPRRKEGRNSFATPTPATDGKRVYAVFADGGMGAVDFGGRIVWTNREVAFYSRHGLGASPLLHENLLIMPFDGSNPVAAAGTYPEVSDEERLGWQIPWDKSFLLALDTTTGKRVWTARRGLSRIAHVTPNLLHERGRSLVVSPAGDVIQAFDLDTGAQVWRVFSQGEGVTPSFAMGDGLVFTASGFEKTTLRTVRTGGSGDVTRTHVAWEQKRGTPTLSSLLYVAPYLYSVTDGGIVHCYRAEDGSVVYAERVGGNHSTSPVYADGRIYVLSDSGETTVIAAGPEFKILAQNPIEERCQASIAISTGHLFIRSEKHVWCIGTGRTAAAGL